VGSDLLQDETPIAEVTGEEGRVVQRGHLARTFGEPRGLQLFVVGEPRDLLAGRALPGGLLVAPHEANHVLPWRILIVLPAAPPAAARGVRARGSGTGAVAGARRARGAAVEQPAREVEVPAIEGCLAGRSVVHRAADEDRARAQGSEQGRPDTSTDGPAIDGRASRAGRRTLGAREAPRAAARQGRAARAEAATRAALPARRPDAAEPTGGRDATSPAGATRAATR
jgi:hypothetical protein